jgi:hypothetical protein
MTPSMKSAKRIELTFDEKSPAKQQDQSAIVLVQKLSK